MLSNLLNYQISNQDLWKGRKDSLPKERFFQHVQCVDIRSYALIGKRPSVLLGFCCDEGIRRNEGRIGAREGPDKLREQLAKLACHNDQQYIDIGNICCDNSDLETAQQELATLISYCHKNGLKTTAFGGGHEIAWAHFSGLTPHYPKIGIINFDAHFDLRPLHQEKYGTSGTPFWQINQHCQITKQPFHYCCVGIQPAANTNSLFQYARDYNVDYLTAEQVNTKSYAWQTAFLDDFMQNHEHIYLSICLDVFSDCFAPGVSAPQATGLTPWQVLPLLKYIAQSGKVVSIDIAELSPGLDQDQKTSRLAAVIIAELLNLNL